MEENNNFEAARSTPVSIETWLEQTAVSTGVEREEVLERMVSAYWTLEEIIGLVSSTDEFEEKTTPEGLPDAPERRASSISDKRSSAEQFDQLRAELDSVNERLEELELAALDEPRDGISPEEFESLDEKISSVSQRLSNRQEENREYVATEFDNLRVILEYLFTTTDGHTKHARRTDESIDALTERADSADDSMAEFESRLRNHEVVASLKQEAGRLDVNEADCENCGITLQIALLAAPHCPHCERKFAGIERSRRLLFFSSNTLAVHSEQARESKQTLTWNEQRVHGRSHSRFQWLNEEQLENS